MITIRQMLADDIEDVAILCDQLGYLSSVTSIAARFEKINQNTDHVLWVGVDPCGKVVGFIHGRVDESIHKSTMCEISALVIEETNRGRGIGKKLISAIEEWSIEKQVECIWLHSNIVREEAHHFYRLNGFHSEKTSRSFEKRLLG